MRKLTAVGELIEIPESNLSSLPTSCNDVINSLKTEPSEIPCDEQAINLLRATLLNGNLSNTTHESCFRLYKKCAKKVAKGTLVLDEKGLLTLSVIDYLHYKNWKVLKFSIKTGTTLFTSMALISELLFLSLILFQSQAIHQSLSLPTMILYLTSSFSVMWASHVLFHLVVGKMVGIDFHGYFIFKPSFYKMKWLKNKPFPFRVPGIKYELASFLKVSRKKRVLMLVSAPILANAIYLINYLILVARIGIINDVSIGIGILITAWYFSSLAMSYWRYGDLWKARRLA